MSTGAECGFTELAPGKWEYRLQHWPYGDNDEFTTYGPFGSFRAARDHLSNNHANPGGHSTECLPEGQHVHEWLTGDGQAPVGVVVKIQVNSLGPDAEKIDVIRFIQALPPDHSSFETHTAYGWVPNITRCEPCGAHKEALNAR